MQNIRAECSTTRRMVPATRRVVAVFEAGTAFFDLPRAATLGDLADRLRGLGDGDALISVDIRIDAPQPRLHS